MATTEDSPWVALFRGINVGGRNRLPMADLVALLEGLGAVDVATYIQSGNVVFRHAEDDAETLTRAVGDAIERSCDLEPAIMLLAPDAFRRAAGENPFPDAVSDPSRLHLGFLETIPCDPDLERMEELAADDERFRLIGDAFYLHAPSGIGRSRLAAGAERALGVAMTLRNWRTVEAIEAMLVELEQD